MEYLFGQLGTAVLAMSPRKLFPTPSLPAFGGEGMGETSMLWEGCSAPATALLFYQHPSSYQEKAEPWAGCCGDS